MRAKLVAGAVWLVAACIPGATQERGPWRALSKTAEAITGDVALSEGKLAIEFSSFTIARIRDLEPGEVSAAFDVDSNVGAKGSLYRLSIPATKTFMHKNTLCGSAETEWMAAYVGGRSLHLAFFSGPKMPVFTMDALANSTDLCGTFAYTR